MGRGEVVSEQRKFPLVYQNVDGVAKNVYTGNRVDEHDLDEINGIHACNRCEVDDCEWRGHVYNIHCEPGIDCLAAK